jgi:acyl-CoA dehydrogenase
LRPKDSPGYRNVQKIRTFGIRNAFVGGFEVQGHPVPEEDVIARGREAWEAVFATVNLGKFILGFGAVGVCEHAFAEALGHLHARTLYGKRVTEMPHIRGIVATAFARLTAMKGYAYRALDYLQVAGSDDRRFLLFNAVQKAKVSTEGVKVLALLSECIGARGFESDTYFESALREAPMIPVLEGSTHINFGLTAQFLANYFGIGYDEVPFPESLALRGGEPGENPYLLEVGDRHAKTVRFRDCLQAYAPLRQLENVSVFIEQVQAFRQFAESSKIGIDLAADTGVSIVLGKCLATIVYAQLVAENCVIAEAAPALATLIFHTFIEDLTVEALKLAAMFPAESAERIALQRMVQVPRTSGADYESVAEFLTARFGSQQPL